MPIVIDVQQGHQVCWITLRINGVMRAMSNEWPLQYDWDSLKEQDGTHMLEVIAWSDIRTIVARETRKVQVYNAKEVALKGSEQ